VAMVDVGSAKILWQRRSARTGRLLSEIGSSVLEVDGVLTTLTKERVGSVDGDRWQIGALFLDADTGRQVGSVDLYWTEKPPTQVRRFRHGGVERLVLQHRVYELLKAGP